MRNIYCIIGLLSITSVLCFHTNLLNKVNIRKNHHYEIYKNPQHKSNSKKLSMGVEHLVECSNVARANGFLNSDMCLDHDTNHIMQMLVTDIFERIVTIGILVATYFYFKRLAVTQPINDDYTTTAVSDSSRYTNDYYDSNDQTIECPKCNGSGNSLFNKSAVCNLCGGTGEIFMSKPKRFNLPSKPSSRNAENNYSDDDL